MIRQLVRVYLTILFTYCAPIVSAQSTPEPITADDVGGTYCFEGTAEKGPYVGQATILQRGRAVFVEWRLSTGDTYAGFGLVTGQSVSVGYAMGSAGGPVGVAAVYAIAADRLVGEWPDGIGALYPETMVRATAEGCATQAIPRGRA